MAQPNEPSRRQSPADRLAEAAEQLPELVRQFEAYPAEWEPFAKKQEDVHSAISSIRASEVKRNVLVTAEVHFEAMRLEPGLASAARLSGQTPVASARLDQALTEVAALLEPFREAPKPERRRY